MPLNARMRLKACVRGAVQGVGFRPFVYRLATELELDGWVNNNGQGVFLEVEGLRASLESFLLRMSAEKPPRSFIQSLEASWLDPAGYSGFEIRPSESAGSTTALILPDIATCPDCFAEILDPQNRRFRYPFTNCTNCGPRFSIIEALPYDRANTSMKAFKMCPRCQAEYDDPRDRRFHAQPNACPECGPQLELWQSPALSQAVGTNLAPIRQPVAMERGHDALLAAAAAIRNGQIVAVKGLGGFHLIVDARNSEAVRRLRERKHREEKPFALMFPSLAAVREAAEVSPLEERLLLSPEAPIVLLRRRAGSDRSQISNLKPEISPAAATGNPNLGILLPYMPLHHLLMAELGFPVVATSGNLSDEPICIDEREAVTRLGAIADLFLVHNRPIVRHVDDSVARVMLGRELLLRRARGYAPLGLQTSGFAYRSPEGDHPGAETRDSKLQTPESKPETILAVGAHLKNTVALSVGPQIFISQHIGDLETDEAYEAFRRVIADLERLYGASPAIIAADAHPDYLSSKYARQTAVPAGPRLILVQHHLAHVLACMAENDIPPPVLGVSWDGTGYGLDGTIWGGEFLQVNPVGWERVAHLRPFRLPGGDQAVKEPRRTAIGLLHGLQGDRIFDEKFLAPIKSLDKTEAGALRTMLIRGLNAPWTSSMGRLFDAVASLIGLRQRVRFEGQAAMELEFALENVAETGAYPFDLVTWPEDRGGRADHQIRNSGLDGPHAGPAIRPPIIIDWARMIQAILADLQSGLPPGRISARFHNTLAEIIVAVARRVAAGAGEGMRVVLTGGCFQNRYLTERSVTQLRGGGYKVYWHQRVPPNDGGISAGQVIAAMREAE